MPVEVSLSPMCAAACSALGRGVPGHQSAAAAALRAGDQAEASPRRPQGGRHLVRAFAFILMAHPVPWTLQSQSK